MMKENANTDYDEIIRSFYECIGCYDCPIAENNDISSICVLLEKFKNDLLDRICSAVEEAKGDNNEQKGTD